MADGTAQEATQEGKPLEGMRMIDLFAGLGGFRVALESLGATCVYSNEWDRHVRRVYERNFGELPDDDITKVDEHDVPDHDILCAGFPCQAFSISGKRRGFEDTRGTLFFDVARIVREKRPAVVFMENVKNFASHDGGRTLATVRATMEGLGYEFHHRVLNAAEYGVPQRRERVYMVCIRNDVPHGEFSYPEPRPLERHVEDCLLRPGEEGYDEVERLYAKASERDDLVLNGTPDDEHSDRPIRLGIVNKGCQGERVYSAKGVAITFSAYGGGAFSKTGGYLVDGRPRRLHQRECARVMGYPDSYVLDPRPAQAYKQLGNSVCVDVLRQIGAQIGKSLADGKHGDDLKQ